jgi:hypothetical protein
MQKLRFLLKVNAILLAAAVLIWTVFLVRLGLDTYYQYKDAQRYTDQESGVGPKSSIGGEVIDADGRQIALYKQGETNGDFATDLRFLDVRTGQSTRFAADPKIPFYNGKVIGIPHRENIDSGYGYLALGKTGDRNGTARFDVYFIRFSDMKSIILVRDVQAFDPFEIDAKSFSAIYWDADDKGRFVLFDSAAGKVTIARDLEMQGKPVPKSDPNQAPQAKYF